MERKPEFFWWSVVDVLKSLTLILCFGISGCSTLSYVVDQGLGQWRLMNRARPIDEVMQSPFTKPQTKWAIERVKEAKAYAVGNIGLKATGNYQKYVALDDPNVVYVVAAAHPLKLESKKWSFPIVGEVPYLGFFSKQKALDFGAKVKNSGQPPWDVWVRGANAFSSLGWFPDPLYSSMILNASERDIVEVVIHESVHATVWVGDNVDFNESLANFVGLHGSLRFISSKYPAGSSQVKDAMDEVQQQRLFSLFIVASLERYKREVQSVEQKELFYASLEKNWDNFISSQKAQTRVKQRGPNFTGWNNAALLSFGNYYQNFDVFEKVLSACAADLRRFVSWISIMEKNKGAFSEAPLESLQQMGLSGVCPL